MIRKSFIDTVDVWDLEIQGIMLICPEDVTYLEKESITSVFMR